MPSSTASRDEQKAPPSLTVVAASRNDDHGGNLLDRMQHFIDGLAAQCQRHRLTTELIVVEWNPPVERAPLVNVLQWPAPSEYFSARILIVPREQHARILHSDKLPLFQMIAKNAGIRRARGHFVLATNIDILFSDAIFQRFRELQAGHLYRCDRYDVPGNLPERSNFQDVLMFCQQNAFRINARGRTLVKVGRKWTKMRTRPRLTDTIGARLRWIANWIRKKVVPNRRSDWFPRTRGLLAAVMRPLSHVFDFARHRASGAARWILSKNMSDWVYLARMLPAKVAHGLIRILGVAYAWVIWTARRILSKDLSDWILVARALPVKVIRSLSRIFAIARAPLARIARWTLLRGIFGWIIEMVSFPVKIARFLFRVFSLPNRLYASFRRTFRDHDLHTNACGDFTLMSREDWFRLRGYPDWPMFSWHLDSVLLHQARANGIRHVNWPTSANIYHIEHAHGSGYTPEGAEQLFMRLNKAGLPYLTWPDFKFLANEMYHAMGAKKPVIYNKENWGMADVDLRETAIPHLESSAVA